jgi:hypothetical protein
MKFAWHCMLLALLAGPGCLLLPEINPPEKKPTTPAAEQPAKPRPPVTADRVTPATAYQMSNALRDELDRAEQENDGDK